LPFHFARTFPPLAWAAPAPRSRPSDFLFRAVAVAVKDYAEGHSLPILDVLKSAYGEDDRVRTVMSRFITKAAAIPADTTTSGWADTLVQSHWRLHAVASSHLGLWKAKRSR